MRENISAPSAATLLVRIVEAEHSDDFALAVCKILTEAFPSTRVFLGQVHRRSGRVRAAYWPLFPPELAQLRVRTFRRYFWQHPRIQLMLRGKTHPSVLAWSDMPSTHPFWNSRLYLRFYQPDGIVDQLSIRLPGPGQLNIGLTVDRTGGQFSAREKELLTELQQHLVIVFGRMSRSQLSEALGAVGWGRVSADHTGHVLEVSEAATRYLSDVGVLLEVGDSLADTPWWEDGLRAAVTAPEEIVGRVEQRVDAFSADGLNFLTECPLVGLPALFVQRTSTGDELPAEVAALLTPRQQEVVALLVSGLTAKQVAEQLYITAGSVRTHIEQIYRRLGVHSRSQLAATVHGIGPPPVHNRDSGDYVDS